MIHPKTVDIAILKSGKETATKERGSTVDLFFCRIIVCGGRGGGGSDLSQGCARFGEFWLFCIE